MSDALDQNIATPQQSEQNYRSAPGISQSELKNLQYDPNKFFNKECDKSRKEHFVLGSLVDCLLTTPDKFEDLFFFIEEEKIPTQKLMKMAEIFIEQGMDITLENLEVVRTHAGYNPTWGIAAVEKWFNSSAREYVELSLLNPDKTLATFKQKEIAEKIVESFKTNEFTKLHFEERENILRFYQVEIYYNALVKNPITNRTEEVACKGMLDMVEVDILNKTILPIDIKTTGKPTRLFGESQKKYRYDIQAASYTYGLQKLIAGEAESTLKLDLKEYTILPFLFLVETTIEENIGTPLPYKMSEADMLCGYYGTNSFPKNVPAIYSNGVMLQIPASPGWFTLLEQYLWHRETEVFNYTPKEWYQLKQHGAIISSIWN
ncbi:MAG: hypothetical protein DA328_00975 [Nitrososphaeraceae archaeon]|nr:hypothetical protein [Nitrososphaeraceae archaeon]